MNLRVTLHSVTHEYWIENGNDIFIVKWDRLPMDSKDDIRHKVSVFEVLEPATPDNNRKFIEGSITYVHQRMPTEKRSKKHLKNILSELQRP